MVYAKHRWVSLADCDYAPAAASCWCGRLRKSHRSRRDRSYVSAHFDPARSVVAIDLNVENAAPAQFRALFADESPAGRSRNKTVLHHERGHGACQASRGGIFGDAVLGSKHSGVHAAGGRCEDKRADAFVLLPAQRLDARKIDP